MKFAAIFTGILAIICLIVAWAAGAESREATNCILLAIFNILLTLGAIFIDIQKVAP